MTRARWRAHWREEGRAIWRMLVVFALVVVGGMVLHLRTTDRYTGTQAAADWEIQHREDARQDGLIAMIMDRLGLTQR